MEKKGKRTREESDEEMEEIRMDVGQNNEIVNVEFTFSNIVEENFHSLRSLLKPIFEFQDVNIGDIVDLMLFQHEDVGTTIKTDTDVFGVFSYIPLNYYKAQPNHNKVIEKLEKFLLEKFTKGIADQNLLHNVKDVLANKKIGLVINERAINMPQETIPPAMGMITKEIRECKDFDGYDGRYELDYMIVISKFVKLLEKEKGKKRNTGTSDDVAYYKFETPLFIKKAFASVEYKIPYKEKNLDYLENASEPQFINVLLIKADDFYTVLKNDLGCEI